MGATCLGENADSTYSYTFAAGLQACVAAHGISSAGRKTHLQEIRNRMTAAALDESSGTMITHDGLLGPEVAALEIKTAAAFRQAHPKNTTVTKDGSPGLLEETAAVIAHVDGFGRQDALA